MSELPEMSLMEHLHELRKRLTIIVIAICITFPIGWYMLPITMPLVISPFEANFGAAQLIGTAPGEGFSIKLEFAFFTGLLIAFPIMLHQLWCFVKPALYPPERKLVVPFILVATGLFVGGVVFCYLSVFPMALAFFKDQYESMGLGAQIRFSEYSSLLLNMLIAFGVCFELPVICALLARAGLVTSAWLIEVGRYSVVIIFIVAAILSPPDVMSQILLAVPLLILYGVSIGVVKLMERPKNG